MEKKKEELVLCCNCEHSRIAHPDEWVHRLVCHVDDDRVCLIGPHECDKYVEDVIPF